jgi:hypothetical protein
VFQEDAQQSEVYNSCVRDLIMGCFEGYNAAILAYGQTGSTYKLIEVVRHIQWVHHQQI